MEKKTMRALLLYDSKGTFELRDDVPIPEIGEDDILLQVKSCGICGGDFKRYMGVGFVPPTPSPLITGHEFAGVVVKKGSRVADLWQVGDRVVTDNTGYACGVCPACAEGDFVNCVDRTCIGVHCDGGFAEYVRIPGQVLQRFPTALMQLPESISFPEASAMEPAANAYKTMIQEAQIHAGEYAVVFGPGPLGLMSVQMAKLAGAAKIIMIGMSSDRSCRFEVAKKYGATHILCSDEEPDLVGKVAELLGGPNRADVVAEVAGPPFLTDLGLKMLRSKGRLVRVGMNDNPYEHGLNILNYKALTLRGHQGYNTESWRSCIRLAEAGLLDLKSSVTAELPLSDWREGFEMLRRGEGAKIVLIP